MDKDWHPMKKEKKSKVKNFHVFLNKIFGMLSFQIIIGVFAAYSMYKIFGLGELLRTFLSWMIGVTIVAAFISALINKFHKN